MWLLYAFGSAFFAGITSILAKCGIRKTDSTVATAIRTIVVVVFAWVMVFIVGSQNQIASISMKSLVFLVLSGIATGASWLCYFYALSKGPIDKVVPIDKSSTVLTIILAFIFLQESVSVFKVICMILIGLGTYLMIDKKGTDQEAKNNKWLLAAFGSAIFASLTAILGKVGIDGVESNLGTAIRTCVVLVMAWMMVGVQKKRVSVPKNELGFLVLSGIATGASWLCYYKALQTGNASVVVPVDKLSVLITILFSYLVFKEKLSKKSLLGLISLVVGTLLMIIA
jgi:bacterial/archaeal transporter family protein